MVTPRPQASVVITLRNCVKVFGAFHCLVRSLIVIAYLHAEDIVRACPLCRGTMGTGCHTEAAFIKLHPVVIICTFWLLKWKSLSGGHSVIYLPQYRRRDSGENTFVFILCSF